MSDDEFERKLFLCRNQIEDQAESQGIRDFYIPAFPAARSCTRACTPRRRSSAFISTCAIRITPRRSRFSTSATARIPSRPGRFRSRAGCSATTAKSTPWRATGFGTRAREPELKSPFFGDAIKKLRPIIQPGGSDSSSLDNALELLVMGGRDILHSMLMLVPAAWQGDASTPSEVKEFYEYHQTLNEPWDGPRRAGLQRWPHHRRVP